MAKSQVPKVPSTCSRILEINVKSAELLGEDEAQILYIKLWINKSKHLKTKKFFAAHKFPFNQKFVFSIPHTFYSNNNKKDQFINFKLFRAAKRYDSVIGEGKSCLPKEESQPKYDTEEEEDGVDKKKKKLPEELPEVRGSMRVPIVKKKKLLDINNKKNSKVRGSVSDNDKGFLNIEFVVWKDGIRHIGGSGWGNLAMEYEEFMGIHSAYLKKKKVNPFLNCFTI